MVKYVETQTRKIISAYGGVGSIFESTEGALIIDSFDKWTFVKNELHADENFQVLDNRLIQRLRCVKAFEKLEYLFQVPHSDKKNAVTAKYFPEWFFCNHCERFKPIKEWFSAWKLVLEKYKESDIRDKFIEPKCAYCFDKAKENKERRKYYELEQVRFMMTSPSGKIRDIPWEYWTTAEKAKPKQTDSAETDTENNEEESKVNLTFEKCCEKQDLRYKQSEKFEDLRGINIVCISCKKRNTLTGLFGLRLSCNGQKEDQEKSHFKPVIRSSNSVYYPILVSSLYLPINDFNQADKNSIDEWFIDGEDSNFIYKALKKKYSIEEIDSYINSQSNTVQSTYIAEMDYRQKEYAFIFENSAYHDKHLRFQHQELTEKYKSLGIDKVVKVSRLKMTTVQTGYTRQEPLDIDTFLNEDYQDYKIKPQYTSSYGKNTKFLPAIESLGEGIFISFDVDRINQWITDDIKKRVEVILQRSQNQENVFFKNKLVDISHAAKFMLIHTFSHILIKELEFLCGYSAISLNERLYIDDKAMQGVLIYTVAGAEGSYGGLITQAEPNKLVWIIESALERAKECSSDPVCYHAEEQGVGGLNLAACYSCALLPETSCEELNCFLDRQLLIDSDYGFFENTL